MDRDSTEGTDRTLAPALRPTATLDFLDPDVLAFAHDSAGETNDERDRAVRLFYAVRDGVRYDPYFIDLCVDGLRASTTLRTRHGWCVPKAILLAACCRALGIPAMLGFADVRNHLATPRLRRLMGTDVFYWHGYASIRLGGRWVKATPAFDREMTARFGLTPLDFDGETDSLYQPFDAAGSRHMEYVHDRGVHADVPVEQMVACLLAEYPILRELGAEAAVGRGGRLSHRERSTPS